MRIAYISNKNPEDINNWSGTPYHIISALRKYHEVDWGGGGVLNGASWYHRFLNRQKPFNLLDYSEEIGKVVSEMLKEGKYDLAISSTYSLCSHLDVDIPLIAFSDLTYNLCTTYLRKTAPNGLRTRAMQLENRFLQLADAIIYPSSFAKEAALADYDIRSDKVHVLEFGANIPAPVAIDIDEFKNDVCKLVFVGRDWINKGGNKALAVYSLLRSQGFPCELTIIGCEPIYKVEDAGVKVIPWLDKSVSEDLLRYDQIMRESHFLILPTEFDAYGIVFCEASAYGVPSLAPNVGGVSQPIREGVNGFLFSPHATAQEYADKIKQTFQDKEMYRSLRKSSRREYETRLNWSVWAKSMNKIMDAIIQNRQSPCVKSNNSSEKAQSESKYDLDQFYIPVYAFNLKSRPDRLTHLQQQFKNKPEFKVCIVEAVEHEVGAVGLWMSICKAIRKAQERNEDLIILCEDDHEFTPWYTLEYLLSNVKETYSQGAELLNGGIGGFGNAVPVAANRSCVDWFWCTQFIVIFASLFSKILAYEFKVGDTADGVLSKIAHNPQVMYPPISTQKDFGYSDILQRPPQFQNNLFQSCNSRLAKIHSLYQKFLRGKML